MDDYLRVVIPGLTIVVVMAAMPLIDRLIYLSGFVLGRLTQKALACIRGRSASK